MKRWGILIGGLIFALVFNTQAQTDINSLFSIDNENVLYSGQAKNYSGSPLVFIEGISDKPQPKNWKDKLKIKLFGSMELPKSEVQQPLPPLEENNVQNSLKIISLFGGEKEVLFTPHTSDWGFIIQILNNEEIVIQEDIQLIKTTAVPTPIRNWPKQNLQLLEARINGKVVSLPIVEKDELLELQLPELETGVHRIRLTYLIKNAGIFSKESAKIALPLMDTGWNLATDSLNGVILFPVPVKKANASFLLGKNQQEIKEAFEVIKDRSGALFFHATHLMPAHSAIQLNLDLQYNSFIEKNLWGKMMASTSFLIFITSLAIIFLYLILNVIEIKITPITENLRKKKFQHSNNSFRNFLYRTSEIWIGLALLWICTFFISYIMKTSLFALEIQVLFLIPIVFVLIIDYLFLYPHQKIKGEK